MRPPDLAGIRARVLLIRGRYYRMVPFEVLGTLGAARLHDNWDSGLCM